MERGKNEQMRERVNDKVSRGQRKMDEEKYKQDQENL